MVDGAGAGYVEAAQGDEDLETSIVSAAVCMQSFPSVDAAEERATPSVGPSMVAHGMRLKPTPNADAIRAERCAGRYARVRRQRHGYSTITCSDIAKEASVK